MWKVERLAGERVVVLALSGRIEREHLQELQRVFFAETGGPGVVLDLRGVRLVDQAAVLFLAQCEAGGFRLRNCPAYIRAWMTRAKEPGGGTG